MAATLTLLDAGAILAEYPGGARYEVWRREHRTSDGTVTLALERDIRIDPDTDETVETWWACVSTPLDDAEVETESMDEARDELACQIRAWREDASSQRADTAREALETLLERGRSREALRALTRLL